MAHLPILHNEWKFGSSCLMALVDLVVIRAPTLIAAPMAGWATSSSLMRGYWERPPSSATASDLELTVELDTYTVDAPTADAAAQCQLQAMQSLAQGQGRR